MQLCAAVLLVWGRPPLPQPDYKIFLSLYLDSAASQPPLSSVEAEGSHRIQDSKNIKKIYTKTHKGQRTRQEPTHTHIHPSQSFSHSLVLQEVRPAVSQATGLLIIVTGPTQVPLLRESSHQGPPPPFVPRRRCVLVPLLITHTINSRQSHELSYQSHPSTHPYPNTPSWQPPYPPA